MTKPHGILLSEAMGDWLFHATKLHYAGKIARSKALFPRGKPKRNVNARKAFVSMSVEPNALFGSVVLVFRRRSMRDRFMEIDYTEAWQRQYPDHAAYVTGSAWDIRSALGDALDSAEDEFDEPEREDFDNDNDFDEAEEQRELNIERRAKERKYDFELMAIGEFQVYKTEQEWISKEANKPIHFVKGELVAVLCRGCRKDALIKLRGQFQRLLPPRYVIDLNTGMKRIKTGPKLKPLKRGGREWSPKELLQKFGHHGSAKGRQNIAASR